MLAFTVLFTWPLVVIVLFRKYDLQTATIVSIVGGYLLLPVSTKFDLPVLPAFDKTLVPTLSAAIMAVVTYRSPAASRLPGARDSLPPLSGWLPRSMTGLGVVLILIGGAALTALTNRDPLSYGSKVIQGIGLYDSLSFLMNTAMGLLTFLLARKFLAHPKTHGKILLIFCAAGLLYSLPTLYEVRMSPQLNNMVYGFFPHAWKQHVRDGGFRPLVFLGHGLSLGVFLSVCVLAAIGVLRSGQDANRKKYLYAAAWLLMTLVLSKNLGALLITLALFPVLLLTTIRTQLMVACVIAITILSYPVLRGAGLVPVQWAVEQAAKISEERARSLQFRITNEDALLAKANEKPLFGWGGFGRSRVNNEQGQDVSVTDGHWIIIIGLGGWMRYIGEFGALTLPIIILALRRRRYEVTAATAAMCVMLVANLIDLIPNAGLTPLTWLLAGSLMGRLEYRAEASEEDAAAPDQGRRPASRSYSRARPANARPRMPRYSRQSRYTPKSSEPKS